MHTNFSLVSLRGRSSINELLYWSGSLFTEPKKRHAYQPNPCS